MIFLILTVLRLSNKYLLVLIINLRKVNKKNTIFNYNNKSSYQNIFEEKKYNKNHIKLTNKIFNSYKNNSIINKINNNIKKEEITCDNNKNNINNTLKNIHFGIKNLLDGLYTIYLNANISMNNAK